MRMKIPQPIQLWFQEFNTKFEKHGASKGTKLEVNAFLSKQKSNPFLLIGINTLILDFTTSFPPCDGAVDVLRVLCQQLLTFFRAENAECRNFTIDLLPSVIFVYLYFQQHASQLILSSYRTSSGNLDAVNFDYFEETDNTKEIHQVEKTEDSLSTSVKAKTYHKKDGTGDALRVVDILEKFLEKIYHLCITNSSDVAEEYQNDIIDEQRLIATPTVFNDPLRGFDAHNDRATSTKSKSAHVGESSVSRSDEIQRRFSKKETIKYKNIAQINEQTRMPVLESILHSVNENLSQLSEFALHSICRIAILSSPRMDQRQKAFELALPNQQTGDQLTQQNNPLLDGKQGANLTESDSKSFKKPSTANEAFDVESGDVNVYPQSSAPTSVGIKIRRKMSRIGNQTVPVLSKKSDELTACPRLNGLTEAFILEILISLQSVALMSFPNLLRLALECVESRANFELWSKALLVINSMKKQVQLPELLIDYAISDKRQKEQEKLSKIRDSEHNSAFPLVLKPEQITLASAYCSLWSELVNKRYPAEMETTTLGKSNTSEEELAKLKIVKVARDKFMRSIVTNANFQTSKPPDDIPEHASVGTKAKALSLPRSSSMSRPFSSQDTDSLWTGEIEDLRMEENPTWSSSRDWFKKTFVTRKAATKF